MGWVLGTELQPVCTPPCATQAMCRVGNSCECSLGYEGDGRVCTGKQKAGVCRRGALDPLQTSGSTTLSSPQWQICARRGTVAAVSMPTAARWGRRSTVPVCPTTRVMAGAAELATPAWMATVEAAVSTLTASTLVR